MKTSALHPPPAAHSASAIELCRARFLRHSLGLPFKPKNTREKLSKNHPKWPNYSLVNALVFIDGKNSPFFAPNALGKNSGKILAIRSPRPSRAILPRLYPAPSCFQAFIRQNAVNFLAPICVYPDDVLNMATASAFPISLDSKILAGAKALAPWSWASSSNAGLGASRSLDAETSLIARCLSGEQGAWEDLVKTYTKRVYGICYRFTGRDNEAQDLTQDVFLRVFKTLGSFRAGEGSFVVWLTRLTRNLLVDHYRRTKHDRVTDAIEDKLATLEERTAQSSRTDGLLAGREAGELLQAALQKLSPELREAVILRDLQEMEYREIARVLDVPEGTVKSRLNRGRAELAKVLRRNKVTV